MRRATSFPGRRDGALLLDTPTPRATRLSAGFVWAQRDKPAAAQLRGFSHLFLSQSQLYEGYLWS